MAHQLDIARTGSRAGQAAMFSVKQTPWHQLGVVLNQAPTLDAAMDLGGLNFNVELHPMEAIVNGERYEVPGARAVMRMDSHDVLGTVGPSYHVLQNRHAFGVLEPLIDSGVASIETGGTLRGGRDVWMQVRFNIESEKVRRILGDEVQPYALISNNHNGSRKVTVQETPVRVVCANTLGAALGRLGSKLSKLNGKDAPVLDKGIVVRHTANVRERVTEAAAELFGELTQRYEVIADQYAALKSTILSEELFARLVLDVVAPLPDASKVKERKDNIAKAAFEKATARATEKRNRLSFLWTNGDGHQGDASAWEAYNAATQSLDHDADMWGAKDRLESLFDGNIAQVKQEVVNSLVGFVASSTN